MNGAQGHMASDPCERVLDYAYGELEGEALEQFKLHLLTCDKCKAELAGLERVRAAVKQALPTVEPPPDRMNAMTAQLLHAAAQNKPKEGKLLMFARKTRVIVSHPAYLAAASIVLIGGAIGLQWSLGRLTMAPEKAASETAVAAPEKPAPVVAAPQAAPEFELKSKDKEIAQPEATKLLERRDENQVVLDGAGKQWAVRPAPKPAAPAKKSVARKDDALLGAFDDLKSGGEGDASHALGGAGVSTGRKGGIANNQGPVGTGAAPERSLAKEPPKVAAPADDRKNKREVFAEEAQAPPPPAAPAAAAPQAPPQETSLSLPGYRSNTRSTTAPANAATQQNLNNVAAQQKTQNVAPQQYPQGNVQKSPTSDAPVLRKQAAEYASSGRCEEAVRSYQELERRYPSVMTMNDRLNYVQCLRQTGRVEQAQNEQNAIENEKRVSTRAKKAAKPAAAPASEKSKAADSVLSPSF